MTQQENWTNDALNSLESIQKAVPSDDLLGRVMAKLPSTNVLPKWQLRIAAVAVILLIALNIYVFENAPIETIGQPANEHVTLIKDFTLYQ